MEPIQQKKNRPSGGAYGPWIFSPLPNGDAIRGLGPGPLCYVGVP